ncbi:MAG: hypothetical protein COB49_10765 [Alphaproteobacteria bacterium]|nr:MAG: hypothetical protein COB49_10765 [Alphaproteobacteria bacterium]
MARAPKTWKSVDEQIGILQDRGMTIDDEAKAAHFLRRVGYYRLSGYWFPFRQFDDDGKPSDTFIKGSTFTDVIALYLFDRRLKLLAMDALERIELSVQVDIAHLLGRRDLFAHYESKFLDKDFVKEPGNFGYEGWLEKYHSLVKRSKAVFVRHNLEKYGKLPIWVAIEVWDFGALSFFYKGMKGKDKTEISRKYGSERSITDWLRSLNYIRNVSAHHSRLWNCNIVDSASMKGFTEPLKSLKNERPFLYFCIMKQMLDVICPDSSWGQRFKELVDGFPNTGNKAISLENMGVPDDWKEWELWQ